MRTLFKIIMVISVLFLELAILQFSSGLSHGMIVDTEYRRHERLEALRDSKLHPSPETEARFQEELRLMHKHEDWKEYLEVGSFFAFNAIWIYYYFRGGRSNTASKPPVIAS
jgi:hypothetical protein